MKDAEIHSKWGHEKISKPFVWDVCFNCNHAYAHMEPMRTVCPHCNAKMDAE